MGWYVVKCARYECGRYLLARAGSKRKKCTYCGRSFKVDDHFIQSFTEQYHAREYLKKLNSKL